MVCGIGWAVFSGQDGNSTLQVGGSMVGELPSRVMRVWCWRIEEAYRPALADLEGGEMAGYCAAWD